MNNSRSAYDLWHAALPVDARTETPWHEMVKRRLVPARDLDQKRVLEIGCGRGGFACWLASQSPTCQVVAADFSSSAVQKGQDFAREHGIGGIHWETGDIQAIAHPAESFDTVISCETIEHVPNPTKAVRELARVLKPGGRLLLTTPNYFGLTGLWRIYRELTGRPYAEDGQPINNFTLLPKTRAWVVDAGLRVEATEAVGHYLPTPGRPAVSIRFLERFLMLRWIALHSAVFAIKA